MKQKKLDKIDELVRKENLKQLSSFKVVLIVIAFLSIPFVLFFPISTSSIEGVAYKYSAKPTELGNSPIMWVKINNDYIVKASLPIKLKFEKGGKVELVEKKTLVGARTYKVIRYVE